MRRQRKSMSQINVVPYIDVMLVLLVIFMVTAPLITPGEIELPSVGSRLVAPAQPLEVTLRSDRSIWLRDQQAGGPAVQLSRDDLIARIRDKQARLPDQPVVIAADKASRYEDVLAILDLLQRSGARKVGLLARPPGP
ncbi:MAG: ExbD/TolR family protein [Betaproteobacteria bacterium]|nr:ExbD/TolR family protein [Betaproteobacteria bacterium]